LSNNWKDLIHKRLFTICFVSQEYPPETGWGGIGSYIYEMANALTERGHHVIVLSKAIYKEGRETIGGVNVYRILPANRLKGVHFFWRFQRYFEGYRRCVARNLERIVKEHDIDIIEAPEARGELLWYQISQRRRPAIVIKLHTPRWLVDKLACNKPKFWNRLEYLAEKTSIRKADVVYSCSHALLEAGKEYLPPNDYPVVYNPINLSGIPPRKKDDGKTVLFVGRLEWHKGVQVFGDVVPLVLKKNPRANFVLLGPDSNWHGGLSLKGHVLNHIPESMKNSVHFLGGVSRDEVFRHLREASICVLPSLWENFPYTCLEAMASGCAVVGSRNGGMAEMIEDGVSGILADPADPEEISEAILKLLNDQDLRRQMEDEAVIRVREMFSTDKIVEQTLGIYRQAIEMHGRKKT
jgi:glycogen(starch) synthase